MCNFVYLIVLMYYLIIMVAFLVSQNMTNNRFYSQSSQTSLSPFDNVV